MNTIALLLSYRGEAFHGFVRQPGLRTIEGELRARLQKVLPQPPRALRVAARTDAGVHAQAQVLSFRTPAIDLEGLLSHVNAPGDDTMHVRAAFVLPRSFHARASATSRVYSYRIALVDLPGREARQHWRVWPALNVEAMRRAAELLQGRHNFTSFRPRREKRNPVCHMQRLEIHDLGGRLLIELQADRFLRRMARCLVGLLLEVGAGQRRPEDMPVILEARDRRAAGLTAPARGLTLERVYYPSALLAASGLDKTGAISPSSASCSRACTLDRIWAPMDVGEGGTASSLCP